MIYPAKIFPCTVYGKTTCTVKEGLRYSSIITLKKLVCTITHALHEQQKYRGVFASAREIDDVSTARIVLKNSSRV